ncbi:hypothetical protein Q73_12210 [Bacillus coahuilensis m2-6]|nr:hypothetical protein Q73_12210 [Bacillus coahuilensis m2-6]
MGGVSLWVGFLGLTLGGLPFAYLGLSYYSLPVGAFSHLVGGVFLWVGFLGLTLGGLPFAYLGLSYYSLPVGAFSHLVGGASVIEGDLISTIHPVDTILLPDSSLLNQQKTARKNFQAVP